MNVTARTVSGATLVTILVMLPPFLVGALAVLVRRDLGFGEVGLGGAVAAYFLASALASFPGGRLADHLGARNTVLLATGATVISLVGAATLATDWASLVLFLGLAGVAGGIAQPAANLALAQQVPPRRQGVAFGAMKAAAPASTLLAGAAVPLLGVTVGWRWSFASFSVIAVTVWLLAPPRAATTRERRRPAAQGEAPTSFLIVLAIALACAGTAVSALTVFFVESAVAAGTNLSTAGLLLVAGSLVGIVSRVTVGWVADRRPHRHVADVAWMIAVGSLGFAGLAFAGGTATIAFASVIAFGAGWGWPGLFNLAVVRSSRSAPATAIGITQAGGHTGSVIGPIAFGFLASTAGYRTAWVAASVLLLIAAGLLALGRRLLERRSPSPSPD